MSHDYALFVGGWCFGVSNGRDVITSPGGRRMVIEREGGFRFFYDANGTPQIEAVIDPGSFSGRRDERVPPGASEETLENDH